MVPWWNNRQSQGKTHVSICSDLLDGLLIGQAKPLFDEQCPKRQSDRLCWGASGGIELRGICFFQLFPRHQGGEDRPAVVRIQRAAKRYIKMLD